MIRRLVLATALFALLPAIVRADAPGVRAGACEVAGATSLDTDRTNIPVLSVHVPAIEIAARLSGIELRTPTTREPRGAGGDEIARMFSARERSRAAAARDALLLAEPSMLRARTNLPTTFGTPPPSRIS